MKRISMISLLTIFLALIVFSQPSNNPRKEELQNEILKELVVEIENGKYGEVHSVLIQVDGELVFEYYFHGYGRDTLHSIASVNKSFLSASIGIAIDQEKIKSIENKVLDFFPEYTNIKNLDGRKRNITLKDLLTMSSGLSWERDSVDMPDLIDSDDWIKHMLDLPMDFDPGTAFKYCTGHRTLLDGILQKTTGLNAKDFSIKHILTPLDITDYYWKTYEPHHIAISGVDFRFRPIDLIKFGQLFLNEGIWKNKQIISKEWIKLSTSSQIKVDNVRNYGFQWWQPSENHPLNSLIKKNDIFYASGAGGQKIWIVPHLNLVAVSTASNSRGENMAILWDYILKFAQDPKNR